MNRGASESRADEGALSALDLSGAATTQGGQTGDAQAQQSQRAGNRNGVGGHFVVAGVGAIHVTSSDAGGGGNEAVQVAGDAVVGNLDDFTGLGAGRSQRAELLQEHGCIQKAAQADLDVVAVLQNVGDVGVADELVGGQTTQSGIRVVEGRDRRGEVGGGNGGVEGGLVGSADVLGGQRGVGAGAAAREPVALGEAAEGDAAAVNQTGQGGHRAGELAQFDVAAGGCGIAGQQAGQGGAGGNGEGASGAFSPVGHGAGGGGARQGEHIGVGAGGDNAQGERHN